MTFKVCTEWNDLDTIEATCPHCEASDLYCGGLGDIGDIIRCTNPKCKKQFKLGEQQ